MARSTHPSYSAADRYERRAARRQQPTTPRRQGTRHAVVARHLAEVTR